MNYKPVILVTSHLNSKEKIDVIKETISKYKEYTDIPFIHASNYMVDQETQKLFDYTVIKENVKSNRVVMAWNTINIDSKPCKLVKKASDYGFSHLDLMLYAFKICKSLGFNYVYHINYDALLDRENFDKFISNGVNKEHKFYPYNLKNNDIRITTILFSIGVDDFINALNPKIKIYKKGINEGLFSLKEGWLAEEFFEWVFNSYYGYEVRSNKLLYEDLIRTNGFSNELVIDGEIFTYFYDTLNNRVIYINSGGTFKGGRIIFTNSSKEDLIISRYSDNIFCSPLIEGVFYNGETLLDLNKSSYNDFYIE